MNKFEKNLPAANLKDIRKNKNMCCRYRIKTKNNENSTFEILKYLTKNQENNLVINISIICTSKIRRKKPQTGYIFWRLFRSSASNSLRKNWIVEKVELYFIRNIRNILEFISMNVFSKSQFVDQISHWSYSSLWKMKQNFFLLKCSSK